MGHDHSHDHVDNEAGLRPGPDLSIPDDASPSGGQSRRSFLRQAGVLGIAAAATSVLGAAGQAAAGPDDPELPTDRVPTVFEGVTKGKSGSDPIAIVIGSGFGGSIAALRLGRAGIQTLVLERGQHYRYSPTKTVFGNELSPNSQMFWFENTATWPTVPPVTINPVPGILEVDQQNGITIGCGAAVGGGSLVYTGCTVQPPQQYFEALWPSGVSYQELNRIYYPLIRNMLSTTAIPPDIYHSDPFTHSRLFDQEMATAGYPTTPVPSDFNWAKIRAELAGIFRPSAIIGESTFGNSDGAKNDMTQTYLPLALATGHVFIRALTNVTTITTRPGGGYLVNTTRLATDGTTIGTQQLGCDLLFLAAGSLNTTKLLVAARDTGTLPNLNSHIGKNWGTNGDAFALRTFSGPEGKTQAAPCVSTTFIPHGFDLPIRVENWYALALDGTPDLAQFSVTVDMDNRGTWTYDTTTHTVKLTDWNLTKNTPSENAAQAVNQKIIDLGLADPAPFPPPTALTAHPLGGCELGKATDLYGRIHGYQGLYAIDGSIVPGNIGGANPSLTIAAMAERSMANIIPELPHTRPQQNNS